MMMLSKTIRAVIQHVPNDSIAPVIEELLSAGGCIGKDDASVLINSIAGARKVINGNDNRWELNGKDKRWEFIVTELTKLGAEVGEYSFKSVLIYDPVGGAYLIKLGHKVTAESLSMTASCPNLKTLKMIDAEVVRQVAPKFLMTVCRESKPQTVKFLSSLAGSDVALEVARKYMDEVATYYRNNNYFYNSYVQGLGAKLLVYLKNVNGAEAASYLAEVSAELTSWKVRKELEA